jgi:hypothetical protein
MVKIHSVISHQTKAARCELFLHRLHEHWAITVEQIPPALYPPPSFGTSRMEQNATTKSANRATLGAPRVGAALATATSC